MSESASERYVDMAFENHNLTRSHLSMADVEATLVAVTDTMAALTQTVASLQEEIAIIRASQHVHDAEQAETVEEVIEELEDEEEPDTIPETTSKLLGRIGRR